MQQHITAVEQHRIQRYIGMAQDMQSYRDYTVEMQNISAHMNTCGATTKKHHQLQNSFDTYEVARETYLEHMQERYQVVDVHAIQHEMLATEPLIAQVYHQQQAHQQERVPTTIERAYAAMQKEQQRCRQAATKEQQEEQPPRPQTTFEDHYKQAAARHVGRPPEHHDDHEH